MASSFILFNDFVAGSRTRFGQQSRQTAQGLHQGSQEANLLHAATPGFLWAVQVLEQLLFCSCRAVQAQQGPAEHRSSIRLDGCRTPQCGGDVGKETEGSDLPEEHRHIPACPHDAPSQQGQALDAALCFSNGLTARFTRAQDVVSS